jgi:lysophospholipase L1-like esterase
MDRMKGGTVILIVILLTLLLSSFFAIIYIKAGRDNYLKNCLLRLNPLEESQMWSGTMLLSKADIWMIGDSRIARWDTGLLNDSLVVANLGIDGQTSSQVYLRLRGYLEADTPSLIILQAGINDLKLIGLKEDLSTGIIENLCRNYEAIIKLCTDRNIKILFLNIFPTGRIEPARRLIWNKRVDEALITVNESIKSFSDGERVFFFDAFSILSAGGNKVIPEYQDDFLHINGKGYEVLSAGLELQINKILNK